MVEHEAAKPFIEALTRLASAGTLVGIMLAVGALPLVAAFIAVVWRGLFGRDGDPRRHLVQD